MNSKTGEKGVVYRLLGIILFLGMIGGLVGQPAEAEEKDRKKWNKKYLERPYNYGLKPADFLKEKIELIKSHLPEKAVALDIAAGEGRNAVYLAQEGMEVDAVDISEMGLAHADRLAKDRKVSITTITADLEEWKIPENKYDLIVNFFYLQRSLFPQIEAGLKKGGLLVFETYTVDQLETEGHKLKRAFLLERNELLQSFKNFRVLYYEETKTEKLAYARLIAVKQ